MAGINADYDDDIADVIVSAKNRDLDVLAVGVDDLENKSAIAEIFCDGTMFGVPNVIVAGAKTNLKFALPKNFRCMEYAEILPYIQNLRENRICGFGSASLQAHACQIADELLLNLGFKIGTCGTQFIRDCILSVLANSCRPTALTRTIYAEISAKYNTNTANLMRCTRTALETAWKHRPKNAVRLDCGASFDDFKLCPSLKEFIYYIARKLHAFLQKLSKLCQI